MAARTGRGRAAAWRAGRRRTGRCRCPDWAWSGAREGVAVPTGTRPAPRDGNRTAKQVSVCLSVCPRGLRRTVSATSKLCVSPRPCVRDSRPNLPSSVSFDSGRTSRGRVGRAWAAPLGAGIAARHPRPAAGCGGVRPGADRPPGPSLPHASRHPGQWQPILQSLPRARRACSLRSPPPSSRASSPVRFHAASPCFEKTPISPKPGMALFQDL